MIITKEDCRQQISSADKEEALSLNTAAVKPAGLISVRDISEDKFREAVRAAKKADEGGGSVTPSAKKEITVFDNEPLAYSEETKGDNLAGSWAVK